MIPTQQKEFLLLLNANYNQLERFVLSMTQNVDQAKDVLSETILITYSQFSKIKNCEAFLSYMMTIATRTAKRAIRESNRFVQGESIGWDIRYFAIENTELLAEINILRSVLLRLKIEYREAITLVEIMGYPIKEAASLLNISQTNLKVRLFRARKQLRAFLHDKEQEESAILSKVIPTVTL